MKYIFLLSGDYLDIAREETISLLGSSKHYSSGNILIAEGNEGFAGKYKRLALAKGIFKVLFECNVSDIEKSMKNFGWNSVYKHNFCIRVNFLESNGNNLKNKIKDRKIQKNERAASGKFSGSNLLAALSERNLAKYIWRSVKYPKVELKNPQTSIHLFIAKKKAYCGLLIFENKENFEARKSNLRPFSSPTSLHPKLARALVNLTEIKKNEVLIDPFCGAGGFLIEAGLMGIKSAGYDINKIMIKGCMKNLEYFKINNYTLKSRNALDINDKFDCLVTDLPYGLNSNVVLEYHKDNWKLGRINKKIQKERFTEDLEEFYLQFLKNLRKKLRKKAVIIFPDYADYRGLLKKSGFRIEKEFSNYVHGSLTRKIVKIS